MPLHPPSTAPFPSLLPLLSIALLLLLLHPHHPVAATAAAAAVAAAAADPPPSSTPPPLPSDLMGAWTPAPLHPRVPPSPPSWNVSAIRLRRRVVGPPPKKADVPAGLWPIFTMDGRAKEESYFVDDTQGGAGSHYRYPRENIDAMVTHARKLRSILARAVEAGRADRPLRALGKNVRRPLCVRVCVRGEGQTRVRVQRPGGCARALGQAAGMGVVWITYARHLTHHTANVCFPSSGLPCLVSVSPCAVSLVLCRLSVSARALKTRSRAHTLTRCSGRLQAS